MADIASRVVSLVPSLTETIFDLGLGGRLVGVTRYCIEPVEGVRFITKVGGTKNPNLQLIEELEPDLVLVNAEENRPQDIAWLSERLPVYESMPRAVLEAADVLRTLGERLGATDSAEAMLLEIEAEITRAEVEGLGLDAVRVFYPIWKKPWMSANRDTYIHDVLTRAGALNVCNGYPHRYPTVELSDVAAQEVELVLLPSEPFVFQERHRDELVASKTFGPRCQVLLVDGKDFCWHGSRTGRALGRVVDLLQPYRKQRV